MSTADCAHRNTASSANDSRYVRRGALSSAEVSAGLMRFLSAICCAILLLDGMLLPVASALASLAGSMNTGGYPNPIWLGHESAFKISLANSNTVSTVIGTPTISPLC